MLGDTGRRVPTKARLTPPPRHSDDGDGGGGISYVSRWTLTLIRVRGRSSSDRDNKAGCTAIEMVAQIIKKDDVNTGNIQDMQTRMIKKGKRNKRN